MTKKLVSIEVRGRQHEWAVTWVANEDQITAMRADGFDVLEIRFSMPAWVMEQGLAPVWCFFQDLWNFRNPWGQS